MKVSLLLPTRNNFKNLKLAVESYLDMSANADNVDIILALDIDDPDRVKVLSEYSFNSQVKIFESLTRHGYANLHKYTNRLAWLSRAEYLGISSDDLLMLTQDWDKILAEHKGKFHIVNPTTVWIPEHGEPWERPETLFPFFPKKWVELTGRVAECVQVDSWIGVVNGYLAARSIPILHNVNIKIEHDLKTRYAGRRNGNKSDENQFHALRPEMKKDADILGDFLEEHKELI